MKIQKIENPDSRSHICNTVLRALPDWFGVEASIVEYVQNVREMSFFAAAMHGEDAAGFIALKDHNRHTAEIAVMGLLSPYHRKGIGSALVSAAEEFCRANGKTFLTVKTLADTVSYEPYARTRSFYAKCGFLPLEIFPLYWDEDNPCLFLAKKL